MPGSLMLLSNVVNSWNVPNAVINGMIRDTLLLLERILIKYVPIFEMTTALTALEFMATSLPPLKPNQPVYFGNLLFMIN